MHPAISQARQQRRVERRLRWRRASQVKGPTPRFVSPAINRKHSYFVGWIWEVRRPANLLIAKSAEFLRLLPSRSTKFLPNFFGHTHNFPTMSSALAVPFRRRSLHQMTTSGQFGGTGGSAGGRCFWVSSSSSSSSGAVSAFPSSAAKCRSAMMARVSARSGSSSTVGDRSRHLYRRNTAILSKSSGSASSGSGGVSRATR